MRRARARMDQPGATVTVVDKQIDDLLSSLDEKEPAEPATKTRPKRSRKSEKRRRRVVITGMGALTPLGLTVDEYWQGLIDGRSGLGEVTLCDATGLDCMIDGEVKGFDPRNYMDHKEARRMARFAQLLVAASRAAIEDSGLKLEREDPYRPPLCQHDDLLLPALCPVLLEPSFLPLIKGGYVRSQRLFHQVVDEIAVKGLARPTDQPVRIGRQLVLAPEWKFSRDHHLLFTHALHQRKAGQSAC